MKKSVVLVGLLLLLGVAEEARAQAKISLEEKLLATIPDDLELSKVFFSADGRSVAYVAKKEKKFLVVVGNERGEPFDSIEDPVFSSDGKVVAYEATEFGKAYVVVGTEKGEPFDDVGVPYQPKIKENALPV